MKITIGILAWNEAEAIGLTIASLAEQTLFTQRRSDVELLEVVCVPNGCSDRTGAVAQEAMEELQKNCGLPYLRGRVHELATAGKSNAWNEFIHQFSDQSADYVFLLDADVRLHECQALANMLEVLMGTPSAVVATGAPVKDIAFKSRKNLFDLISLAVSDITQGKGTKVAGCLYCTRGETIRQIWMPSGLLVEDGFFRAMIVTDQFRRKGDDTRVVRAANASAIFNAYRNLNEIFRHERRLAVGVTINGILYSDLWANSGTTGAGELIRKRNAEDPNWFARLVRQQIEKRGEWVLPRAIIFKRFKQLKALNTLSAMARFPVAVIAFALDMLVYAAANAALKRQTSSDLW